MSKWLFRGKRIDSDEWEYGYYVRLESETFIYSHESILVDEETNSWENHLLKHEVQSDSVGMWIGELDKDDVKIYSGSIVIDSEGNKGVVRYMQAAFWCTEIVTKRVGSHGPKFDLWSELKIIGNTTDNPELMEEKFSVRDKITILKKDDSNRIQLGYKCIEVPHDKTVREHCKDILSPKDFEEMEKHMVEIEIWKNENE